MSGKVGQKTNRGWHAKVWYTLKALCKDPLLLDAIIANENTGSEELAKKLFGNQTPLFDAVTGFLTTCAT